VTVEQVVRVLMGNTQIAQEAIGQLVQQMSTWAGDFPAHHALKDALITERSLIPAEARKRLALLVGKYLA
jgi:5'-methylthioadenosine phosphorylase